MASPHVYRTEAVVLRQRRLGDADKICVLFTPQRGRIEAVAKGVRRTKSRLAGHVEPLARSTMLLAAGRSLDVITQAQTINAYPAIHDDLDRLSRALYVAELVDRFTDVADDSHRLYELLIDTFDRIATAKNVDMPVRWFEIHVLEDQGYQPELNECVRCQSSLLPEGNAFSAAAGGVVCPTCRSGLVGRPLSAAAFKLLRFFQSASYADVERVRLDDDLGRELEAHLRDAIHQALDQDVRASEFVNVVRAIHGPQSQVRSGGE
jgi:DNA repair protein RecO (recombination protein O)